MNIEDFRNLIETESIEREIAQYLQKNEQEKGRIILIKSQISAKQKELANTEEISKNLSTAIKQNEKELTTAETRIKRIKETDSMITNNNQLEASKREMDLLTIKQNQIEGELLNQYDELEIHKKNITDLSNFLSGVVSTEKEIQAEVDKTCTEHQQAISQCEERITNLLSITSKDLVSTYKQVQKKYRFNNSLCFVERDTCNRCHMQVGKNTISMIEKGTTIELCPGCNRLLAPISAKLT